MDNKKREIIVIIVAVAIVAVVTIWWSVLGGSSGVTSPVGPAGINGTPTAPASSATRTAVPANTVVPTATSTGLSSNVAIPSSVAPGNPTGSTDLRVFSIKIENNAFTPDNIVVYDGDTVTVNFTAVGKTYDWTLPDFGMQVTIPAGATRSVQLSPHGTGKYLFYCAQCGGPKSGPTGYLVVVPKTQ